MQDMKLIYKGLLNQVLSNDANYQLTRDVDMKLFEIFSKYLVLVVLAREMPSKTAHRLPDLDCAAD